MAETVFNPEANPETSASDGVLIRSGINETWATIIAGNGVSADSTGANIEHSAVTSNDSGQFNSLRIIYLSFDTASIGGDVPSAATIEMEGELKSDTGNMDPNYFIGTASAADPADIVASDYQTQDNTPLSDVIAFDDINASGTNTWTFNDAGLLVINTSGVSEFLIISDEPSWAADKSTIARFTSADGATAPILRVTHAPAPVTGGAYVGMM